MRLVFEPEVYFIGQQTINVSELNRFLKDHEVPDWSSDTDIASQKICEIAGRLCYMSFVKPRPGGNKSYIGHLLEVGHGSVLEHAVFSFIITNVSRSCTHELVRHRAGFGYSQLSQRYVDESQAAFIKPKCIENMDSMLWDAIVSSAQDAYQSYVEALTDHFDYVEDKTLRRKLARQAARSVLPNATETKIFVTANARALRHFIELRCTEHAEIEIRQLGIKMLRILMEAAPNIFGDYTIEELSDGTEVASTKHRKV